MGKGMENCARKWCLFLCTIVFEVTLRRFQDVTYLLSPSPTRLFKFMVYGGSDLKSFKVENVFMLNYLLGRRCMVSMVCSFARVLGCESPLG